MLKNRYAFIFLFALITGCTTSKTGTMKSTENILSKEESADGWNLLFDGSTLKGWHTYGKQAPGRIWEIREGAIFLNSQNKKNLPKDQHGDLVTDEEYGNFHLKLEWKISPKGNSGIIFFVHEDLTKYSQTYQTGLEMQVLDNGTPIRQGHGDARLYTHRAGDLYDLLAAKEAVRPQGEWNAAEIKAYNGKLDFYLNGEHVLTTTLWDKNWGDMVANSKFKDMPGFGKYKSGRIALQDHDDEVWYRNIKIKRL